MSGLTLAIYVLKFFIPAFFSVLFRGFGLGYRSEKSFILGIMVFTIYATTVPTILIIVMGYGEYTHISAIVMVIAGMSVIIFTTDTVKKTIFLHLIQSNVTTTVSVILNMIRHCLNLSYVVLIIMLLIVSPIIYLIALRLWVRPLRFIADNIHGKLLPLISLPIIIMVIVNLLPVYPEQNFSNHPMFCTIMMLAVELVFFIYIYTFYSNLRQISILSKVELKWELLQAEMNSYHEYIQDTKKSRHDLRHHQTLVLEYLENGDLNAAINYLRMNNKELEKGVLIEFCENPIANTVLRIYERRAKEKNITFVVSGNVPKRLLMTAPEFGGVLGNLFENALEACTKSQNKERHIVFVAGMNQTSLLLELRNTVDGQVVFQDGLPVSNKANGGIGTKSIEDTVQKYEGIVEFNQKESEFITRIILPM